MGYLTSLTKKGRHIDKVALKQLLKRFHSKLLHIMQVKIEL